MASSRLLAFEGMGLPIGRQRAEESRVSPNNSDWEAAAGDVAIREGGGGGDGGGSRDCSADFPVPDADAPPPISFVNSVSISGYFLLTDQKYYF